jgi:hypothetical protein
LKVGANTTIRKDRIVRWGTRPRDAYVSAVQPIGVKELEPWPNNWVLVKDLEKIPDAPVLSVVLGCRDIH